MDENYPVHYIIHKNNKVHGLTKMEKDDIDIPAGTRLLIIPDAGTNDSKQCNLLIDCGIDVIVLDHHEAEDIASNNKAIIVNNQMSNDYTCKAFSGVGIAYEFAKALDDTYVCDLANKYLDLVAFGNISDVMDIRDYQTRYYINQGIVNISNKFLQALNKAQEFSTKGEINIHNISWYWTPIVNSMIRIGSYEDRDLLFRAFIETDEVFPYKKRGCAEIINEDIYTRAARLCKNIKSKQDSMRNDACDELIAEIDPNDKVAVVVVDDVDSGIIGLSCMKIADTINKPCMVLREYEDGKLGGSCRNCRNSIVDNFKDLVVDTGLFSLVAGHNNAFGVEIDVNNLEAAKEALNAALASIEIDNTTYCDFLLWESDVDYQFVKEIDDSKWLYGAGLEEPIVVIEGIPVSSDACFVMGENNDSISFISNGIKYCKFKCNNTDELLRFVNECDETMYINVVGKCSINNYKGNITAQITIEDYEVAS